VPHLPEVRERRLIVSQEHAGRALRLVRPETEQRNHRDVLKEQDGERGLSGVGPGEILLGDRKGRVRP
jgi:hypothetical protein